MSKAKNLVFYEVQAALLNSECDPADACAQALCAFYMFAATELEGSVLATLLKRGLGAVHVRSSLRRKVEDAGLIPRRVAKKPRSSKGVGLRAGPIW